ncbi:MAG: hypothetical protein J7M03_06805 [Candidatus Desulfofervidaceae bacterium]|nr:hypothetical protein [Candidatus Desulfofervidaceae bacterium]
MEMCPLHEKLESKIDDIFEKLSNRKSADDVQDERLNRIEGTIQRIEKKTDCLKKQISQVSIKVGIIMGVFSTIIAILQVLPVIKTILK